MPATAVGGSPDRATSSMADDRRRAPRARRWTRCGAPRKARITRRSRARRPAPRTPDRGPSSPRSPRGRGRRHARARSERAADMASARPTARADPARMAAPMPGSPSSPVVAGPAPTARMTMRSCSRALRLARDDLHPEKQRGQGGNSPEHAEGERFRAERLLGLGLQLGRDLEVGEVLLRRVPPALDGRHVRRATPKLRAQIDECPGVGRQQSGRAPACRRCR